MNKAILVNLFSDKVRKLDKCHIDRLFCESYNLGNN